MATCEKLEHNKAKLTMTIDPASFAEAVQTAYQKGKGKYNVPGFRKGHAPRKVIETMYGEGVFYEDAFDAIWGAAYDKALDEHKLEPVDQPSLDIDKISLAEGVTFTAEVQLKPEITLGAYKGIEVEAPTYTVEDSDVEAELQKELEKNARFVDVDRTVENGDRVTLDYSGSVDGVKFDGGTAEEQVLLIGSNTFIPGFEEQIVGMKAGEEKDITVTFPKEYHAENLAGKEAVFAIKLREVQIKELPALDDEFIKDISEFDTVDAYRADKKQKLTEKAEENRKTAIENAAVAAACANVTVEIPEAMIERQANAMLQDLAYRLQMSGLSIEDYCKYTGSDLDTLRKSYHADAENRVKTQLVLEAVGKAENIESDDEAVEKLIADYAARNETPVDEFKKNLSEDDMEYLRDRVITEKTVRLLADNAVLAKPKKPAKKASKKAADETAEAPAAE